MTDYALQAIRQTMNLAVFDIDGTLTQPYRIEDPAFLEGLEEAFGFRGVDADWTRYPHVTDTGIVTTLCLDRWGRPPTDDEIARFQEAYFASFVERAQPGDGREISGASAFIAALRNAPEWCVAVATGNCHRFAVLKLTRAGVPCLDLPMATADDACSRADLVRLAVERARTHYGVADFVRVVSIGDAPWDLQTARELGLPFVVVGSRCGAPAAAGCMIVHYDEHEVVLAALREAICW